MGLAFQPNPGMLYAYNEDYISNSFLRWTMAHPFDVHKYQNTYANINGQPDKNVPWFDYQIANGNTQAGSFLAESFLWDGPAETAYVANRRIYQTGVGFSLGRTSEWMDNGFTVIKENVGSRPNFFPRSMVRVSIPRSVGPPSEEIMYVERRNPSGSNLVGDYNGKLMTASIKTGNYTEHTNGSRFFSTAIASGRVISTTIEYMMVKGEGSQVFALTELFNPRSGGTSLDRYQILIFDLPVGAVDYTADTFYVAPAILTNGSDQSGIHIRYITWDYQYHRLLAVVDTFDVDGNRVKQRLCHVKSKLATPAGQDQLVELLDLGNPLRIFDEELGLAFPYTKVTAVWTNALTPHKLYVNDAAIPSDAPPSTEFGRDGLFVYNMDGEGTPDPGSRKMVLNRNLAGGLGFGDHTFFGPRIVFGPGCRAPWELA